MDFLVANDYGSPTHFYDWYTVLSKGNTLDFQPFSFVNAPNFTINNGSTHTEVTTGDINGDGFTDIICAFENSNSPTFDCYFGKGNTSFKFETLYAPANFTKINQNYLQTGDFNGDAKADIVTLKRIPGLGCRLDIASFQPTATSHLLHKVADGIGYTTEFRYNTLARGNYTKGSGATYPLQDIQKPLYVAASVSIPDGIGGVITDQYRYTGAKVHLTGRGFLGFTSLYAQNPVMNTKSISDFDINTSFYVPLLKQTTTYSLSSNQMLSSLTPTNQVISLSNNRYWTRLSATHSIDISGAIKESALTYDIYGNVTQEMVHVNYLQTTITDRTFPSTPITGAWIPSKPIASHIVKSSGFIKDYTYSYDPNTGSILQEKEFAGQAQEVTTDYTYDGAGMPFCVSVSANGVTTRSKCSATTTDGIVQWESAVNNSLEVSTSMPHATWQAVDYTWSAAGVKTEYSYDNFGRLTQTNVHALNANGNNPSTNVGDAYSISQSSHWDIQNGAIYYTLTEHPGAPDVKKWYDIKGRNIKTQAETADGYWVESTQSFNAKGNKISDNEPYFVGASPSSIRTYSYDALNRLTHSYHNLLPQVATYSYTYFLGNTTVTATDFAQRTTSKTSDALGRIISSTDNGGTVTMEYPSDFLQKTKVNGVLISQTTFDSYGRQASLIDADAGTTSYTYNAFDELIEQTDANGNLTTMKYDDRGRMTDKTGVEGTTIYSYYDFWNDYPANVLVRPGLNQVKSILDFNGEITNYVYDDYSRLLAEKQTIVGTSYVTSYQYDKYGNSTQMTYPSGLQIDRTYDTNGFLTLVRDNAHNQDIFTAGIRNALGQFEHYDLGTQNIHVSKSYDDFSRPIQMEAYNLTNGAQFQNLALTYDNSNGNLLTRVDYNKWLGESFTYDNLDRLTSATVLGQNPLTVSYMNNGNINAKTDAGVGYSYSATQKHAVVDIAFPTSGTSISLNNQDIEFTSFQQPSRIEENNNQLAFLYGHDYQRRQTTLTNTSGLIPTTLLTRTFVGDYEKNEYFGGGINEIHYIGGGDGLAALAVTDNNGVMQYYYVLKDHLGSILTVIDENSNVIAEQNFDAWGRERNPDTWEYANLPTNPDWLYRGYTGHEHLPLFGLINMNGRLYDPIIGRMLSPDNYVKDPYDTQGHNRYSYVLNNPLKYNDPSGEWIQAVIGGLLGAYNGYSIAHSMGYTGNDWQMYGCIAAGAAIGALSGGGGTAVSGALGQVLTSPYGGLAAAVIGGAVSGGLSGLGFAALSKRDIGDAMWKGALSGALSAGVASYIGGGEGAFLGGAVGGAVGALLNKEENASIAKSALISGFLSWGAYQLSMVESYNRYSKKQGNLTFKQFNKMSVAAQQSFARGQEYGGWILSNGDIEMWTERSGDYVRPTPMPKNAVAEFHTHPHLGKGWDQAHSEDDKYTALKPSYVISRQNVWYFDPLNFNLSNDPTYYYKTIKINAYPFNVFSH